MSDKVKLLMSFRARLMLLMTAFLLLTSVLVLALDKWASKRVERVIVTQTEQITDTVNKGYGDLAEATNIAMLSLDSDLFLYEVIGRDQLPRTVEGIIITEEDGTIRDSTLEGVVGKKVPIPESQQFQVVSEDPLSGVAEWSRDYTEQQTGAKDQGNKEHLPKTYYHPIKTTKGKFWIVIVTTQKSIINKIEAASERIATENKALSNYRLAATTGVLVIALALAVIIGWGFTRPINELVVAARRVAAGNMDFQVDINRPDEMGELATTFNEMIAGLRSKRELEEKLNQAERSAVIGRLTQSVAHEIRNPLNVINLSIDHASTRYAPEDEARRGQFLRILSTIKDEIARLKHLVNDLLNYGRPAQLAVETVDVRKLVSETMSLVRPQADEQGVSISVQEPGQPAEVVGDRERLKSCLSNIAINALQAMPNGGRLATRVAQSNGYIEIDMTDTGVGISEESIGKVFEPYFSTKQAGFGLGLAVTRKIVEEHKGSIEVKSEINRGTTFTVRLPAATNKS
ncbi:MAG TPA: ATP-binding protein [Blastocatellia bacterium]|nr:ATP-binding protein [Blastocatellia bacterium]